MLDGANIISGCHRRRADSLAIELAGDVCINGAESIHDGKLLGCNESDLELLELLLDLSRHHDNLAGVVRSCLIVELNLLVTRALNRDADFEVAGDLGEIFTTWVEQGNPLMLQSVFLFEVDRGHVKLVHANHVITEYAVVHDLDHYCLHFYLALMLNIIQKSQI